jgi:thiamine-phosphate pyrophosphorylase
VDVAARAGWDPAGLARAFLDGGAQCLQLRAKALSSDHFLALADTVVAAAARVGARVTINDRADISGMSGAAGVHVGQDELPPERVRALLGPGAIVGRSTHSLAQIDEALTQPVDYIAVGPIFGTRTKDTGYEPVGVSLVAQAVGRSRGLPVVAIGGITLEMAPAVLAAGASSVAVIGDLLVDANPSSRIATYLRVLGEAAGARGAGGQCV